MTPAALRAMREAATHPWTKDTGPVDWLASGNAERTLHRLAPDLAELCADMAEALMRQPTQVWSERLLARLANLPGGEKEGGA